MRPRFFEFRLQGLRGLPGALLLALGVLGVLGLLALLMFVGVAVVVAGLAVSAGVALWHGLRRKLAYAPEQTASSAAPESVTTITEVREIEVEVLPERGRS
ncbi:MAG: hypothetical protein U1F71_12665 [Verrucomicrobiaceae bacterium]